MLCDGQQKPSLWLGRVEGVGETYFSGNMVVERPEPGGSRSGAKRHFCLSGEYVYYLIRSGGGEALHWYLLIDTGAGAPDSEALSRDFLALQFVLGRQLRMPELFGVANDRRTIARASGIDMRKNIEENSIPPVPLGRNNESWVDESWVSVFFERLIAAWKNRREQLDTPLSMALETYLEAMTRHLDADYLRLQVVLESFSYWLLRCPGREEPMVVQDKASWKKWVKESEETIRGLARPEYADSLLGKVRDAYRLSSGRVVPSAFRAQNLFPTPEMKKELEGRDFVVHQGLMAPAGYDVDRDLRRVAMVRTMLVALIAKTVGYSGAINGWEAGRAGYPCEPSGWWVVGEEDRQLARSRIVVEEILPS
jgi:hypothetical protein